MLRRSFVLLRGVGVATERRLRASGVLDWSAFLAARKLPGIGAERRRALSAHLRALERCLARGDSRVLFDALPARERWRVYPDFRDHTAFLDIETTGLEMGSQVTVVGVFLSGSYTPLVRGISLSADAIQRALRGARLLVTFNGSSFDLPMLRFSFPSLRLDLPHIDLRHLAPRAGLRGGLKRIEKAIGLSRPREIRLLVSHDAVYLWRIWERKGSRNALRLLIDYNRADCLSLRVLIDEVVRRLAAGCYLPASSGRG